MNTPTDIFLRIAVIMSRHVPMPLAPEPRSLSSTPMDPLTTPRSRYIQQIAELQTIMSHVLLRLQRINRSGPSEDDFAAIHSYFTEYLEEMKKWYTSVDRKQGKPSRRDSRSQLTGVQRGISTSRLDNTIVRSIYDSRHGSSVYLDPSIADGYFSSSNTSADPSFSLPYK